ncbi:MAG: threonine/serine dehydratase [Gemmatimonadota bacterium]
MPEAVAARSHLVSAEEIREAAKRLRGVIRRTPLVPVRLPPRAGGGAVWLKCENLQHVSAFKARGAYHFVARLPERRRRAGLVTYSSGNHAQGVAFAARAFGVEATIVMPVDAPPVKLARTRALGARVEQVGTTAPERRQRAEEILRKSGGTMVPPFDHPDIIAGQGTMGLELVAQLREAADAGAPVAARGLARILVPIGGGGLISGVAAAMRGLAPEARVVGVEPEGAAGMKKSLEAGAPVTLERVDTIADGLKPVRPGDLTFKHCRELVEEVVTVSDDEIRKAVVWLFHQRLVVEPSGAATVAALLEGRIETAAEGETVAVLSGGNIEPGLLAGWLVG